MYLLSLLTTAFLPVSLPVTPEFATPLQIGCYVLWMVEVDDRFKLAERHYITHVKVVMHEHNQRLSSSSL
jgi:hypothetical protein